MLHKFRKDGFGKIILSHSTQPSGNYGATVTPGNNVYGSYAQVIAGASVTDDVYAIRINFNSNDVSAAARDTICTIGIDPAGGTSYTDTIQHLLASCAASIGAGGGGINYWFPLFIKAGSSIACKASVNNATVGTLRCFLQLQCQPAPGYDLRVGRFVRTFGATTGTSSGTAATPGTTSPGSWVSLGITADELWHWQMGVGVNDSTMNSRVLFGDLSAGNGTTKRNLIQQAQWTQIGTAETLINTLHPFGGGAVASGETVYGRLQTSSTPDTGYSVAAYAVGG